MSLYDYLHGIAQIAHVLSVTVWVGGMFFAYMCLRPVAASALEPPQRLGLWVGVFRRFFPWVWAAVVLLLASGFAMMFTFFGGFQAAVYVHLMLGIGIAMMLIFMHVFFAPYRRLQRAVAEQQWSQGAAQLGQIRRLVGINTVLGLVVIAVAAGGRYLAFG